MLERPLGELLEELATGSDPLPGGGTAAAVAGAMAAALVATAARLSPDWDDAEAIGAQAQALRRRLAPLAQEDADAYAEARALLAGGVPGRLGPALERAAQVPLRIAAAASDVAELAMVVVERGDPAVRGEAAAGAALAEAAVKASAHLVEVNLTAAPGDPRVEAARDLAAAAARASARALRFEE